VKPRLSRLPRASTPGQPLELGDTGGSDVRAVNATRTAVELRRVAIETTTGP
jgi:hypothetical protein